MWGRTGEAAGSRHRNRALLQGILPVYASVFCKNSHTCVTTCVHDSKNGPLSLTRSRKSDHIAGITAPATACHVRAAAGERSPTDKIRRLPLSPSSIVVAEASQGGIIHAVTPPLRPAGPLPKPSPSRPRRSTVTDEDEPAPAAHGPQTFKTRPLRDDGMTIENALTIEEVSKIFFYCRTQDVGFFYQTAVI